MMSAPGKSGRDSVAERMIDVAVARIDADGMSVGLDDIGMERVIQAAGVSRATAYRRWSSREDFLADVLVETVRRTSLIPETEDDVARLLGLIQQHLPGLGEPQTRRDLVVEAFRVAVDADVRRILASPRWRTYLALAAAFRSLPDGRVRDEVGQALAAAEVAFVERRARVYGDIFALVGYRPVEGSDWPSLSAAAGAMMNGIVMRALPAPGWLDARTAATLFGASRPSDWSAPERMLVGVLLAHVEPDPRRRWEPSDVTAALTEFEARIAALHADSGLPLAPR